MVKYYKNGFYESYIEGSVEISDAYWQELLNGQKNGHIIISDENGFPVLKTPYDMRTYKEKREAEYPSIGDMIDALVKARGGDSDELEALCTLRQNIKNKYPKE